MSEQRNGCQCIDNVHLQIHFFRRCGKFTVGSLCVSPALFYEIEFTVELRQEYHLETPYTAFSLQERRNIGKIRFVVQEAAAAAVRSTRCTFKFQAFCLPSFCPNTRSSRITTIPLKTPARSWPSGK